MSRLAELLLNLLKGISDFEWMMLFSMMKIMAILYATSDYIKSVILCFQLKGPPAQFVLGNVLLLIDKNGKSKVLCESNLCPQFHFGCFNVESNKTFYLFPSWSMVSASESFQVFQDDRTFVWSSCSLMVNDISKFRHYLSRRYTNRSDIVETHPKSVPVQIDAKFRWKWIANECW